jgi:glycosyltransferase involved in cell wall biosynthesis
MPLRLPLFLFQIALLNIVGYPVVWTIHNEIASQSVFPKLDRWGRALLAYYLCDHLLIHCSAAQEIIIESWRLPDKTREKFTVINHGHYINDYPSDSPKELTSFDRGEGVTYLYLGSLKEYKGVTKLVEAFKEVARNEDRLIIVGSGKKGLETDIRRAASGDKRIYPQLEFVSDERIQDYVDVADITVFPFRHVLTSGSIILAMSFGLPVISVSLGCIPEIVSVEGSYLYNPETEQGLCNVLKSVQNEDLDELGKANLTQAKKYDWTTSGRKTRQIYNSIA